MNSKERRNLMRSKRQCPYCKAPSIKYSEYKTHLDVECSEYKTEAEISVPHSPAILPPWVIFLIALALGTWINWMCRGAFDTKPVVPSPFTNTTHSPSEPYLILEPQTMQNKFGTPTRALKISSFSSTYHIKPHVLGYSFEPSQGFLQYQRIIVTDNSTQPCAVLDVANERRYWNLRSKTYQSNGTLVMKSKNHGEYVKVVEDNSIYLLVGHNKTDLHIYAIVEVFERLNTSALNQAFVFDLTVLLTPTDEELLFAVATASEEIFNFLRQNDNTTVSFWTSLMDYSFVAQGAYTSFIDNALLVIVCAMLALTVNPVDNVTSALSWFMWFLVIYPFACLMDCVVFNKCDEFGYLLHAVHHTFVLAHDFVTFLNESDPSYFWGLFVRCVTAVALGYYLSMRNRVV